MIINDAIIGANVLKNLKISNKVVLYAKFSTSCYFQCENGDFIMLSAKKYGPVSFAISVEDPLEVLVQLGDVGSKFELTVNGTTWQPDCSFSINQQNNSGLSVIKSKLTVFDDVFHNKIDEIKASLLDAAANEDEAYSLDILNHFIGLGQGLTPSADDWVFAFYYTLKKTSRAEYAREICSHLPALAKQSTSFASYAYLSSLNDTDSIEIINNLLLAYSNDDESLAYCCDRLKTVGSSSGQDMLQGIYDALLLE